MSVFTDETPVTLTLTTTHGAVRALLDHPALNAPGGEGMYFVNAVHRAIADLRKAFDAAGTSEIWELHEDVLDTESSIGIAQEQAEQLVAEGALKHVVTAHIYRHTGDEHLARIEEVCDL